MPGGEILLSCPFSYSGFTLCWFVINPLYAIFVKCLVELIAISYSRRRLSLMPYHLMMCSFASLINISTANYIR